MMTWLMGGAVWLLLATVTVGSTGGHQPIEWLRDYQPESFYDIAKDNMSIWVCVYSAGLLVYYSLYRYKFDDRSCSAQYMLEEGVRSVSGVLILSIMEYYIQQYRQKHGFNDIAFEPYHALIPVFWGDAHFYWSHRLLHTQPLFNIIHKLHHKSYLVNPLSGLSMHPLEHLVYFSATLVALLPVPHRVFRSVVLTSIIFPLPAHIGIWPFEKHHFFHHTKFNWNYGSSPFWDYVCGTSYHTVQQSKVERGQSNDTKLAGKTP